jgi:hypothetical protein
VPEAQEADLSVASELIDRALTGHRRAENP